MRSFCRAPSLMMAVVRSYHLLRKVSSRKQVKDIQRLTLSMQGERGYVIRSRYRTRVVFVIKGRECGFIINKTSLHILSRFWLHYLRNCDTWTLFRVLTLQIKNLYSMDYNKDIEIEKLEIGFPEVSLPALGGEIRRFIQF